MHLYTNTINMNHLGYAAIFLCIGIGFLFIKLVTREDVGPGCWSLSFILNSIGFIFWSGILPIASWQYFLLGEVFHMSGFLLFVCGVYRFTEHPFRPWNAWALAVFLMLWIMSILLFRQHRDFSTISLRVLRSILFIFSGNFILFKLPRKEIAGRKLAGISMILWGVYIIVYGFIRLEQLSDFIFGALVGFQVLAAFGLVVMIVDRLHLRAAENEKRIVQLEKLLPICAHCRKIRSTNNTWNDIETYIEEHTKSQFSHGICPDCLAKYFPQYAKKKGN